jgi:hypothetical protein
MYYINSINCTAIVLDNISINRPFTLHNINISYFFKAFDEIQADIKQLYIIEILFYIFYSPFLQIIKILFVFNK